MMGRKIICSVLVSLFATAHCFADEKFHRWTDANGTVHYSQTPPPTVVTEQVSVQTAPVVAANAEVMKSPVLDETIAPVDETLAKILAMEADLCLRAKESLQVLEEGKSIASHSSSGGRATPIVGAEREKAKVQARAQVVQFCVPSEVAKSEG